LLFNAYELFLIFPLFTFLTSFYLSIICRYRVLLADRTNGRAYATVLRLSVDVDVVVVCDVMYWG